MRVLISGGAGFIGSHIADALLARGHEVWALDDLSSGRKENLDPRVNLITASVLRCYEFLREPFDAVCHQAAQPSLLRSLQEPDTDALINVVGTVSALRLARECNAHFLLASTSAVYDDCERPMPETYTLRPRRPYGIAKLACEMYVRESGLPYTILRYGNVYGPRQVPVGENQVIPHALNHIFLNKPFQVYGDGMQTRDFVYVSDIAAANADAIEQRVVGTYNAANGIPHTVNEVLTMLRNITDWQGEWQHTAPKPDEPRHVVLDARKALRNWGWFATIGLSIGLARTVKAFQARLVAQTVAQ